MKAEVLNFLTAACRAGTFPGFTVSFLQDKQFSTTLFGAETVLPNRKPLVADKWYDLASLTKAIVAVITLKVAEEGKLSLTAPLASYCREASAKEITVGDLLTHTAGLTGFILDRNQLVGDVLKEKIFQLTPQWTPGTQMIYSDHHYLLLGFILEEVTGKSLAKLLTEKINQPLGTAFTYAPVASNCIPTSPLFDEKKNWVLNLQGIPHDPKARQLGGVAGHAGIFGRLKDLQKLLQALLGDFLQPTSQKLAFTEQTAGFHRSFGFKLYKAPTDGRWLFSHTGYTGTFLLGDPVKKQGLIFLSNRVHPHDERQAYIEKRDQFIELYLKDL